MRYLSALAAIFTGFAAFAAAQAPAPPAAAAPAPAASAPVKLATIHVQNAIMSTKQGQSAAKDVDAKFAPRRQALEQKQSAIARMQQQMRSGGATMSAAAKDKLTRDIDAGTNSLRRESEDYDSDLQQEEGRIMGDLGQKLMDVIAKYASEHGIAVVIDVSNPQSPVLWADVSLDITTEIVKQFDATHPAAAAPAPPATPPAVPPVKKQ
jgi:outer membrane protein